MAIPEPDVRVFEDQGALSQAAAAEFADTCLRAIAARGRFLVALSGGNTPSPLYGILGQPPHRDQIPWQSTHIFWGDERCVPPTDPENNFKQAWDAFLGQVPVPSENIHRVSSELEPGDAASKYALLLQQYATPPLHWPRFDLVLLGLGEDGHTAALFPGSPVDATDAALAVTGRYQDRPSQRVTLTPLVFNSALKVMFLANGAAKASIVAEVLRGQQRPGVIPAQRIHPTNGILIWLLDREAAAGLTDIRYQE
jgi:6-phosphogluconolactonase